jgi:hypothetical protein
MGEWTINGMPFSWLRNSDRSTAWEHTPLTDTQTMLGTDRSEVNVVGFGPWQLADEIHVDVAYAAAISALNGKQVTIGDGTDTWRTTITSCKLKPIMDGTGEYEGPIEFTGRS